MSDELPLDVPATGPDELTAARTRLAAAQAEYDRLYRGVNDRIDFELTEEVETAKRALAGVEYRILHQALHDLQ